MNMKKTLAGLSLAAIMLAAVPALANAKGGNEGKGFAFGKFFGGMFKHFERKLPSTSFVISGTVVSTGSNSVVVNVKGSVNIPNLVNSQTTVNTDANTKITGEKNATETLADLKAGDRVEIGGNISGSTLTAVNIRDSGPAPVQPVTTSGKVTAVSSSSITLSNAIAGTTQVFTIDSNTKVTIDGVSKAVGDIQVNDAGTIKSKNVSNVFTAQMINLYR